MREKLEQLVTTHAELTARLASPEVLGDPRLYRETSKALAEIARAVELYRDLGRVERELAEATELAGQGAGEPELAALAADCFVIATRSASAARPARSRS